MNRALLKLYWLNVKGALRALGRKFSTVRGALLTVVTLGFIGMMLAGFVVNIVIRHQVPFANSGRSNAFASLLPFGMLAYFLMGISPSLGERAIHFSASEIDFLFPAPFTRRQLLAFYLLRGLVGKLALAILVAVSFTSIVPSIPMAMVGIFLSLVFLHGATIASQLIQQTISTQLYSRARRILAIIVVVAVGIGIARALPSNVDHWSRLNEFRASIAVRVITAPFDVFSRIIVTPRFAQAVPDLAIAVVINTLVYWMVFALDSSFEDAAVRASQRIYERMQAARRGNLYAGASTRTEYARSLVPRLPLWNGIGPNLRRQLIGGLRDMQSMLWLAIIVAVVSAAVMIFVVRENPKVVGYIGYMVLGLTAYGTFIMGSQLPFGFRGDLNHMEVLKSLPIRPMAVATAEVVSATIIGCLGQWFLVLAGLVGAPSQSLILLAGAPFFVPYNLLLFGISNLLLLLFPFRLVSSTPDVTMMGRVMILMIGNLFALLLGIAIAAIPAAIAFLMTASWIATLVAGWFGLMLVGIAQLFAVGWAFRRFDVSTDMPD